MSLERVEYGMGDATYRAVGGYSGLVKLVDEFYGAMEVLPEAQVIRAMHPEDLQVSRDKLVHFLSGWMNGPQIYADKYGSINIPQAHAHLDVGEAERDAWLFCMQVALEKQDYPLSLQQYLLTELFRPAERIRQVSSESRNAK
ncbi:group II truncated hemoglobin [Thiomicrorhabdus xiamenensis]|uniref:Group II truncated hemoglobin n=1 Tax=Thiomicrorhabdus xiamenensis TaxID=2739063 RepID=A0A7D4P0J1_9GAMM|nr:group II truncated hemoglobin [Thiomicrorhabdus xiamenensis]QKI90218.1 group II truncated hemoglobin [Thiomicrorhabdus xiamenensis]